MDLPSLVVYQCWVQGIGFDLQYLTIAVVEEEEEVEEVETLWEVVQHLELLIQIAY